MIILEENYKWLRGFCIWTLHIYITFQKSCLPTRTSLTFVWGAH